MRVTDMFAKPEPNPDRWFIQLFDGNGNYVCSGSTMDSNAIYKAHKNGYKVACRRWAPELNSYIYMTPDGVYWRYDV